MATQRLLGLENRLIIRAATGLGGGVGHEGDTCGALTGGVLSLGLYHRNNECDRLYPDCIEYYDRFIRRFGSSKCRDILGVRFKVGYDIRRFFLKGIRCLKVVYTSIESVFDIIQTCDRKLSSKSEASLCSRTGHPDCVSGWRNSPKQQPAFAEAMAGHHAIHPRASARGILAKVSIYLIRPPFNTKRFNCAGLVLSRIESQLTSNIGSILEITRGFSGGIAFQGDICGAFMGGVLALGTVYGTELRKTQPSRLFRAGLVAMKEGSRVFQNEHLHPSFKTSLRAGMLYNKFVSQFGSVDCIDIIGRVSRSKKRNYCEEIAESTAQLTLDCVDV